MKALSLWQPWASFVAEGHKTIETRSWSTRYRGELLICAAKKTGSKLRGERVFLEEALGVKLVDKKIPLGQAVAIVDLVDCRSITYTLIDSISPKEYVLGNYEIGRYAWILENIRKIEPFPVIGRQGLFNVNIEGNSEL